MSINFALGLALGQKMAERRGVVSSDARRRAGIVLGATGLSPVGLVMTKTLVDRAAAAEAAARPDDVIDIEVDDGADDGAMPPDEQVERFQKAIAEGIEHGMVAALKGLEPQASDALEAVGARIEIAVAAGVRAGIANRDDSEGVQPPIA